MCKIASNKCHHAKSAVPCGHLSASACSAMCVIACMRRREAAFLDRVRRLSSLTSALQVVARPRRSVRYRRVSTRLDGAS